MLSVLLAVVSMMAKDAASEFNMIAQVRGRARLSLLLSPIAGAANLAVMYCGLEPVLKHGLTAHAVIVIAAILATDAFDGWAFTALGTRIKGTSA